MAFGRVCLIGDAAFALRPHAAAGTAKAAADAWALAETLATTQGDLQAALPRWERHQLAVGRGGAGAHPPKRQQVTGREHMASR